MSVELPKRDKEEGNGLAEVLRRLAQPSEPLSGYDPPDLTSSDAPIISCVDKAERLFGQRRRRAEIFSSAPGMFIEPAWDILLLLFIAHERGRPMRRDTISIPPDIDARLAKRWVAALVQAGWVHVWMETATGEPLLALTPSGTLKMLHYLNEASVLG